MDYPNTFGLWVKQLRKELDLTQAELAGRVACSPVTIRKIEADERRPSKQMADMLARALQVTPVNLKHFLASARGGSTLSDSTVQEPSSFPDVKIPLPPSPLVNRITEIASVCALLRRADVHLLTLSGPGGVGKTRLAIQAAQLLQGEFSDGTRFIYLALVFQPELFLVAVAHGLGLSAPDETTARERLITYFQNKRLLLVLDNFEQILESASDVARWLETSAGLKVLVTSRARLRIVAEHEYPVPPMELPDLQHLPPAESLMAQCPTVELFVRRVQAIQPGFHLTGENAPIVAEICVLLDGLPLAIELAAARCRLLAPAALLEQLRRFRPLRLLTGGARDLPARQQTIRQTMDWSYSLLGEAEGLLFERLGIFSGGATLEAIRSVCPESGDLALLDSLQTLMDHSLIWRAESRDESPRFQMLATLREYAVERLEKRGELAECRHRHALYFDSFAAKKFDELRDARQGFAARSLEADQGNLRIALEWCCTSPFDLETGMRLASRLWEYWLLHGDTEEGQSWMERLLSLDGARDKSQPGAGEPGLWRAYLLNGLGMLTHMQTKEARIMFDESLAIFRSLGDRYGEAWVLNHLGQIASWSQDYEQARVRLEESLQLFNQLGANWNIAWVFFGLADLAMLKGQDPTVPLQKSLDLFQQAGDKRAMALCHYSFGENARYHADYSTAIRSYAEALRLIHLVGDPINIARFSFAIGDVLLRSGDVAQALPYLLESLSIYRQKGESWGVAYSLVDLARVAVAKVGDALGSSPAEAASMLGAASALLEAVPEYNRNSIGEYYPQAEQEVRAQLADPDFTAAWQSGRKSLDLILKSIDSWDEFRESSTATTSN